MQPLASKTDVEKFLPVAKGCQAKDIEFHLMEEQSLTLKKWLGDAFFKEYEAKKTDPEFVILLDGGNWKDGEKYCDGLIKVLSYLAYGEYVVFNNYTDTPFGTKIKNFQDGLPTPPEALETLRLRYRNKGIEFFESCKEYLCANKEYFAYKGDCPADHCGCGTENKSIRTRTLY